MTSGGGSQEDAFAPGPVRPGGFLGRRCLEQVLDGETGFELLSGGVEVPVSGRRRADAIWVIRSGSEEWRLLVELKTTLWPRGVQAMATQVKALASDAKADRCLVVAPRLTESSGRCWQDRSNGGA